jgi:dTMP kinase
MCLILRKTRKSAPEKRYEHKGLFITFEGIEGCGKSTQAKLLADNLRRRGLRVVLTSEPGGTKMGRSLRKILLTPGSPVGKIAELFLFEADRAQHVSEVILPALVAGSVVICDRYSDSTRAYQGVGRGLGVQLVDTIDQVATGNLYPDLTILLDMAPERGVGRIQLRGKMTRIDRESLEFHSGIRRAFLNLAAGSGSRFRVVRGDAAREHVAQSVERLVLAALKTRGLL